MNSAPLMTCEYCEREWDGYAQCPCWMYLSDDADDSNNRDINNNSLKKNKKTPLELAQEAVDIKFNTRYNKK